MGSAFLFVEGILDTALVEAGPRVSFDPRARFLGPFGADARRKCERVNNRYQTTRQFGTGPLRLFLMLLTIVAAKVPVHTPRNTERCNRTKSKSPLAKLAATPLTMTLRTATVQARSSCLPKSPLAKLAATRSSGP